MVLKTLSTPKKKIARMLVMMKTMTAVIQVSLPDGHTTLRASARTWRANSPGDVLATGLSTSCEQKNEVRGGFPPDLGRAAM